MATLNVGMKVNRAITGATTVNPNAMALVTYLAPGNGAINSAGYPGFNGALNITRVFGPGQSIPASYTTTEVIPSGSGTTTSSVTKTFTLQSGVELVNTI